MNFSYLFLVYTLFLINYTTHLSNAIIFNTTVAIDGSGDYSSIVDAINIAPCFLSNGDRFYIRIKPGFYNEHVVVWANKTNLALIGDNAATTKITGNRNNTYSILESGTLIVEGNGFTASNITIENSAGIGGQAVALNNDANHTAFYRCVILGYQDTLLANHGVQFYRECDIYGTTDFIFGSAKAVFQDCRIFARGNGSVYVTAQAKEKFTETSGFSFQNCNVTVAPDLNKTQVKAYLGRPWKNYSTVIFMDSFLDEVVQPEGWMDWDNRTEMVFLAEYNNCGPGADTRRRVKWGGVHVFTKAYQAMPFTVSNYIDGYSWIPQTGIPFRTGLMNYSACT